MKSLNTTIKRTSWIQLLTIIVLTILLFSCTQQVTTKEQPRTSLSKEIKEIRPGILEGYLSKDEIPNSLKLIPPPPQKGSAAYQLDQAIAAKYVAMKDEKRKAQAAEAFNIISDVKISEETTPNLYMVLRRTLADAGLSTYSAKDYYQWSLPFMVNNTPICTPDEEEGLRKDGSYPSGHTAIGWAWALILTEVFPEQADVIMERGKQFGISRNVCNVHWHSDVVYGRMMGAYTVAVLHANSDFMIDLEAAKAEVMSLKQELSIN